MKAPTSGKFKCTLADYLSYPAIGSSQLRSFLKSTPMHYKYDLDNPPKESADMIFGSAGHCAVLEPTLFKEIYLPEPIFEGKTKTGEITTNLNCKEVREKYEKWHIENGHKKIISSEDLKHIDGIKNAISRDIDASKLISEGHPEESLFWTDPESDMQCKARLDFIHNKNMVVEFKTTKCAEPKFFMSDVISRGYHIQAAMYLEAANIVLQNTYTQFVIIAVEKKPPYGLSCISFGPATINEGRALYREGLQKLSECLKSNKYPGYKNGIQELEIPSWGFKVGYDE